jgi:serine/threonine protein kinase
MLLKRLAVGGMAEVYVAKAKGIGGFERLVAIKVIHPRLSEDEHFVRMLVEEAKISVVLGHNNIAQCFDLGCIDGTYFIVMEYIDGADAYRLMKRARARKTSVPFDVATSIMAEVCKGLDYAHRKRDPEGRPMRIVHRDVSPQNVLISYTGEVKLVDFGIAKAAMRSGQTEAGVIKGKYYYMSPEQAWGDPMDHRSDIFSAGICLYELLTGEMLYQEDSIPLLLDKVRKAEIAPPTTKRPEIPAELVRVVMKALAREPEARYASAQDMAQELTTFLYSASPAFTSQRISDLMTMLFDAEVRKGPPRLDSAPPRPPSGVSLMARGEPVPQQAQQPKSLVFDDDATSADVPPFPMAPDLPPLGRGGDQEDPTLVADGAMGQAPIAGEWDDATLVDEGEVRSEAAAIASRVQAAALARSTAGAAAAMPNASGNAVVTVRPPAKAAPRPLGVPPPPPRPSIPMEPPTDPRSDPTTNERIAPDVEPPTKHRGRDKDRSFRPDPPTGPIAASRRMQDPWAAETAPRAPADIPPAFATPPPMMAVAAPPKSSGRALWIVFGVVFVVALVGVSVIAIWLGLRESAPEPVVRVVSTPPGANVKLDGRLLEGVTPMEIHTGLVLGQTHRVDLELPGYEPWSTTFEPAPGVVDHIAVLAPRRVPLRVLTDPPGATIYVDEVLHGVSPVEVPDLQVGRALRVRASLAGYRETAALVTIGTSDPRPEVSLRLDPI